MRPKLAFVALILLFLLSLTYSSTHWVVTESGRIQSQVNSIFHMKKPYDLVAFLEQERRVEHLEKLKEVLTDTEKLDKVVEKHEPDLESRFYNSDRDCQKAGQPLTEFDLFASTLIYPDPSVIPEVSKILKEKRFNRQTYQQPYCDAVKPTYFDLEIIDELSATIRKDVLNMPPEVGLLSNVLEHDRFSLAQYGQLVYDSMQSYPEDNWVAPFLASNFWRILGKPKEAIECLRKSIHSSPDSFKHYGLLSLSNIFHRSHNSHDAITVLEQGIKYAPENSALYFTMGNVYATLMQFNNSAKSYNEAIKLQPDFEAARLRKYAVLCHRKLEQALEEQHKSLEETLNELRHYKKQHDEWSALLNKILAEQASLEVRMESRMEYEEFKLRQGKGQNCHQVKNTVTCTLGSENGDYHKDLWSFKSKNVESLLHQFESNQEANQIGTLEPSKTPKYSFWPVEVGPFPWDDTQWPSAVQCTSHLKPKWNEFPTVFLSPENKGFDVSKMMSEDIGIPVEFPSPLPWLPPTCKPFTDKTAYDKLESFEKGLSSKTKKAEREIEAAYYVYSVEKNYHEWGARVHGALERNVLPKWAVYVLAGTYWRIFGNPSNGLTCYKWALSTVPSQYQDVVLTNLAGLLYKAGYLEDALSMMQEAYIENEKEPEINFFLGNLLSASGNFSGALFHYKQAVKMKPDYSPALQFLLVPACEMKFGGTRKTETPQKIEGEDSLILCKDGSCKSLTPDEFLMKALENGEVPHMPRLNAETLKWVKEMEAEIHREETPVKKKKKSKKSKKSKQKKMLAPKPGEDTILVDHEQMKHSALPMGAVEIGTIAETESYDEEEDINNHNQEEEGSEDTSFWEDELELLSESDFHEKPQKEGFIGPINLIDDPVPDVMIKVREKLASQPPTPEECKEAKEVNWQSFTSTWLSVSAKNIDIREYLGDYLEALPEGLKMKPYCEEVPTSLLSMDHLTGVRMRHELHEASESGLKEAFQGFIGEKRGVEEMATRIALEMEKNSTSWVLSTAAALYWRVKGKSKEAVECLRHSLYHAPRQMKDIPLVSLANILHRAGLYNDALIATNMALEISPKFVVTHFTMANIYVSKNELELAVSFYITTLALQSTFEPARDRLLAITCKNSDILKNLERKNNDAQKDEL